MEALKDELRLERSRLSDFELEEAEYLRMKRERERRALEEDIVEVCKSSDSFSLSLLWWCCGACICCG